VLAHLKMEVAPVLRAVTNENTASTKITKIQKYLVVPTKMEVAPVLGSVTKENAALTSSGDSVNRISSILALATAKSGIL
jgi:hypothetical protein